MPRKKIEPTGTTDEKNLFSEVYRHYTMAKEDLDVRIKDFNKKDELFRSFIDEKNWPYQSVVFDPRVFTAIYEKTARLLANKPKGRLVPREGGDALGAKICNELLNFQWDDNERVDANPMLAKWSLMDQNTRKYGASFGLAKWHFERKLDKNDDGGKKSVPFYDGPNFKPLNNRDCLANPSYSTIKNWFQHRDYPTFQELRSVNDVSRGKPVYKNLDILLTKLMKEKGGGDRRNSNYVSRDRTIKNLDDFLGRDEVYKTIEVVTEYRNERWVTFAPKHGVVLRDIPNPYDHGQIPIILLKYYPIDDDLYGLSEIEPVERLQKAINAIVNQYLDAINMSLYTPLKVRSTGVKMHTLKFGSGEKWLMNDPSSDVLPFEQSLAGVSEFASTYRFMVSALNEALGETSAGVSNAVPREPDKTATEVRDSATQRNARDNFNQIFLSEALKKQMVFWHKMEKQFMFSDPREKTRVIRIVGKDAIRYFEKAGLNGREVKDETIQMLASPEFADVGITPQELQQDSYPVQTSQGQLPKFTLDQGGEVGYLLMEPEDLSGEYDYVPDIESMSLPDDNQLINASSQIIQLIQNPVTIQLLQQDGYRIKAKELIEDYFEKLGAKDADKYFERITQDPSMSMGSNMEGGMNANNGGAETAQGVPANMGAMPMPGLSGSSQALSSEQTQDLMG